MNVNRESSQQTIQIPNRRTGKQTQIYNYQNIICIKTIIKIFFENSFSKSSQEMKNNIL